MGQEFFINNQSLEDKIRQLLPSQGGQGAGFDLSASTQIIPIIDLTESAEGSNVRVDLQTAFSHKTIETFSVINQTTSLIVNTGYFRVFGNITQLSSTASDKDSNFLINDGATDKIIYSARQFAGGNQLLTTNNFDFVVFMAAGDTFKAVSSATCFMRGCTRQIATINGELVNP